MNYCVVLIIIMILEIKCNYYRNYVIIVKEVINRLMFNVKNNFVWSFG